MCWIVSGHLCTVCTWGPVWCGRPLSLKLFCSRPVLVLQWEMPLCCSLSQPFPASGRTSPYQSLLQSVGGMWHLLLFFLLTGYLLPEIFTCLFITGSHLLDVHLDLWMVALRLINPQLPSFIFVYILLHGTELGVKPYMHREKFSRLVSSITSKLIRWQSLMAWSVLYSTITFLTFTCTSSRYL